MRKHSGVFEELKREDSMSDFVLSSVGLGLMLGWLYLCRLHFSGTGELSVYDTSFSFLTWKIAAIVITLALFIFVPENVSRSLKIRMGVFSAFFGSVGSGMLLYTVHLGSPEITWMKLAALIFIGFSYGLIIWLWAYSLQPRRMILAVCKVGLSCMISGLVYLVFTQVSFEVHSISIIVLPFLSAMTQLSFQHGSLSEKSYETIESFAFKEPRYLVASVFLLCLLFGMNSQIAAPDSTTLGLVFTRLLIGVLLCFCIPYLVASERGANLTVLVFLTLLVIGMGIALVTSLNVGFPSGEIFRISSSLVMSLSLAVSGYLSLLLKRSISKGFLIGFLAWIFPLVVGQGIWFVWPWGDTALLVVGLIMLTGSITVLLAGVVLKNSDGGNTGKNKEPQHNTDFELACSSIAAAYTLTERESEILVPLAKGYTLKVISDQHSVSYNTIKVQVRSIYQKLNIHSKDELVDLVDVLTKKD